MGGSVAAEEVLSDMGIGDEFWVAGIPVALSSGSRRRIVAVAHQMLIAQMRALTSQNQCATIAGFATKRRSFCPAEALQVVWGVDDGPKTDCGSCLAPFGVIGASVQVGN